MSKEQVTPELLARIAAAFGEHRLDDVVDLFAEDGAFINARGSTPYGDTKLVVNLRLPIPRSRNSSSESGAGVLR
jgi:hypothetical protein